MVFVKAWRRILIWSTGVYGLPHRKSAPQSGTLPGVQYRLCYYDSQTQAFLPSSFLIPDLSPLKKRKAENHPFAHHFTFLPFSIDTLCLLPHRIGHGEKVNFLPPSEKDADTDIKEPAPRDLAKKPAEVGLKLLTLPFANLLEKYSPGFHGS